MEDNNLKEKVKANVKERIAIDNFKKESKNNKIKTKKQLTYIVAASLVLLIGLKYFTPLTKTPNINSLESSKENEESGSNNKDIYEVIKDKDQNVNDIGKDMITGNYPSYYGGYFVNSSGNNVVYLTEDNEENRKNICNFLGFNISKTTFKECNYSYNYLVNLQDMISKKMVDKEFPFISSSSLKDDTNSINVVVTTSESKDINKILALDSIGGAINICYGNENLNELDVHKIEP